MKLGKDIRTPENRCTHCGLELNCANSVDQNQTDLIPSERSFTVCARCGHLMMFNTDLTLRDLTPEEMIRIAGDPRLLAIQRARMTVAWDAAHIEDTIRNGAQKMGVRLSQEEINTLVRRAFDMLPRPPRVQR